MLISYNPKSMNYHNSHIMSSIISQIKIKIPKQQVKSFENLCGLELSTNLSEVNVYHITSVFERKEDVIEKLLEIDFNLYKKGNSIILEILKI